MSPIRGRTAWLSVARGCANRGNLFIEHAARRVLGLTSAACEVSAFSRLSDADVEAIDACDRLVLPGATLLDATEHPAVLDLPRVRCPKLGLGVAFCDVSGASEPAIARSLTPPVGSRDSYTHQRLVQAGIESRHVGCATLLLGDAPAWRAGRSGPIVASLGRGEQEPLQRCVLECARLGHLVLFEHVPALQPRFALPEGVERVEMIDAAHGLRVYASASVVLTGRIHALLTCVALGVPVTFFGDHRDSRYSLLRDLGVDMLPSDPATVRRSVAAALAGASPAVEVLEKAATLRAAMLDLLATWSL